MTQFTVRVLIIKDEETGFWVARCLEYDIAAHGKSIKQVQEAFERAFSGQMQANVHHGLDPLDNVPPAPGYVHELWESAEAAHMEARPLPVPEGVREGPFISDPHVYA